MSPPRREHSASSRHATSSAKRRPLLTLHFLSGGVFALILASLALSPGTPVEAFFLFRNSDILAPSSSSLSSSPVGEGLHPAAVRQQVQAQNGKGVLQLERIIPPEASQPPRRADNALAAYYTVGTVKNTTFFLESLDRIVAAGGNAVTFDVKGSYVYFATNAPMANEIGTAISSYDLPAVLAAAKERDLYTIGRFIAIKDGVFVDQVPEARVRHPKTGANLGLAWSDPASALTITYNRQILETLLQNGIDEVNFDYIRYSTAISASAFGLTGAEKAERLETFLRAMKEARDELSPSTRLGISTYAILGWDFAVNVEPLGQDFVRFAPLVDIISPMAYPSTFAQGAYYVPGKHPRSRAYYLVYRTLKGYTDLLGPEQIQKLRPWIQAYSMNASEISDEIDAVYDAGLCGFTFWNAGNNYTAALSALKSAAERRPERCL